ncbi:hypothetical protein A3E10_01030 [Candidatus Roizmanbacteria bacterium RIFCSPHIGHO2_12_FULL_37_23]|nr:MAG: hypothetical protein A3E10_01030 [Candidatus Roizmanbacteria bacterium RIFCSPHIGHO2_12_FULL_37_23]
MDAESTNIDQRPLHPQAEHATQNKFSILKNKLFIPLNILFIVLIVAGAGVSLFLSFQNRTTSKEKQTEKIRPTESYSYPTPLPQLKASNSSDAKGKIAFVSEGEIWTINSDGTNKKQITNDENNKFHISISSDGKKIAYGFYPKDEKKRTNEGYYVGYNSGLAIHNLDLKETKTLIPYSPIQNHYPLWSHDNKYVSVWVGNGIGSRLIDVSSGSDILNLKGSENNYVSPIVWVPKTDKVNFIENKNLIISNIDGSNKQILATEVDSLRKVHEGPNVPQPPVWSQSGRYVAFYKSGDLHLMDAINKTDVIVEKRSKDEMFSQNYPQAYPVGLSSDEAKLYLFDSAKEKDTVVLDIKTGQMQEIAKLGQSLIMSPDKENLLGRTYDTGQEIVVINLKDNSRRECNGSFDYSYYSWAGGTGYAFRYDTWSPDSKGILGYKDHGDQGLNILNVRDCSIFNLITAKNIDSGNAIWFP